MASNAECSDDLPREPDDRPLRFGIVAGEASGDILGAGLIRELRRSFPNSRFEGVGGDRMLAQGFTSFFPQDRLAVMGLVEPLKRLPELLRMRRFLKQHFIQAPPDVFIGIDSPDFNLDLELALRQAGIKTAHYVSPSVWAWRRGRITKIARAVDLMLTLLPFEAEFYKANGVPVAFVGHPLADEIPLSAPESAPARTELGLPAEGTCIAILPGSRGGEVEKIGPVFLQAARECQKQLKNVHFVIPAASPFRRIQLETLLSEYSDLKVKLIDGRSHVAMAAADAVMMASGTTTLEALLLKRPMVIAYRLSAISFAILSRIVKIKHVGLPNLLAGEELVPEFLQDAARPEAIANQVMNFLNNKEAVEHLQQEFHNIHLQLALNADASAAAHIASLVERSEAPKCL